MNKLNKKSIKNCIIIALFVLAIATVMIFIIRYNTEGEKKLPFQISSIRVVSSAQGDSNLDNMLDLSIIQKNDFYFYIEKNPNYSKDDSITQISFENFNFEKTPSKGNIGIYKPSTDIRLYNYTDEYKIDNSLSYTGSLETNIPSLNISNQGGLIGFSIALNNLGNYIIEPTSEIIHNGTLLSKIDVTQDDLSMTVSFDIIIETSSKKRYKTNISFDLPTGNIIENGMVALDKDNLDDIVFKRF